MPKEGTVSQKSVEEEEGPEVSKHRKSNLNGRFFFFRNSVASYKLEINTSRVLIQDLVTLLKILIIHLHLFFHLTAREKVCVKLHISEKV